MQLGEQPPILCSASERTGGWTAAEWDKGELLENFAFLSNCLLRQTWLTLGQLRLGIYNHKINEVAV